MEQIGHIFSNIPVVHLNILFFLGLALFGGAIGGRIFQRIRVPQVVGYIFIGIILGRTGFNIIDTHIIETMRPFTYLALGLIGFMIGGELKKEVFQKYGKQFFTILLAEGLGAFLFVFLSIGILGHFFFGHGATYWVLALLLGAISSATAPAATTDVLWEYKSRGPLTSTVLGIVALDDVLALVLFSLFASIAGKFLGQNNGEGVFLSIIHPLYEIIGAVVIGAGSGLAISKILKEQVEHDKILAVSIGMILLLLGVALFAKVDMLMASMVFGTVLVNRTPRISKKIFKLVEGFTPPIYVLFFVFVGANLNVKNMTLAVITVTVLYFLGRSAGKMAGATLGAKLSKAPQTVSKYLPLCLFSQAGVAVGLSIVAYNLFPGEIGETVVIVITASTFLVQLIGPMFTKMAIVKAGEVGLNVTEYDLMQKTSLKDVISEKFPVLFDKMPLAKVLEIFRDNDQLNYPVVDHENRFSGIITVNSIRQVFMETEAMGFLMAHDLMESLLASISPEESVAEAQELMEKYGVECLPVEKNNKLIGFIEKRGLSKIISTKMIMLEEERTRLETVQMKRGEIC